VSTLVAGVLLWAAGHPSGPQIAADTGMAIDTSLATCAGHHPSGHHPSGGRSFRKQRTVNPPIVPARYIFVDFSSRSALRPGDKTTVTGEPASPSPGVGSAGRRASTSHAAALGTWKTVRYS
jgi:hypothetical protein